MISSKRKKELDERAKGKSFNLPKDIRLEKELLPNGKLSYVFRHDKLGELGRLLILPQGEQSQFVVEVSGSKDDSMTEKRRALLEPVAHHVINTVSRIMGIGEGTSTSYTPEKEVHKIAGQEVRCEQCGSLVATLIYGVGAYTADALEDYARMMYDQVKAMNVPAWVIGQEIEEVKIGDELAGKSLVLKLWPERIEAQEMLSIHINSQLDELIANHCKNA